MRRPFIHMLLLALAATGAALCGPAAATVEPPGFTLLGSGFTGAPFALGGDMVAESDSLFVTIRDFSEPTAPRVLCWLDHSFYCYWGEILADGPLLVGLTGSGPAGEFGFSVVDIAEPLAPVQYGTFNGIRFDSGWLHGRSLLATAGSLLLAYDLTVLSAPALTSFVPLGAHAGSRWPAAVGNTLYLIDQGAMLRALDVTDALHPASLAVPTLGGDRIDALAAGDGVLYALVAVAVGTAGEHLDLVTCDAGTAGAPLETDRVTLYAAGAAQGRAIGRSGDLLVAATGDGNVRAFGLADPAHPTVGWTVAHDCNRLAVTPHAVLVHEGRDVVAYVRTPWDTPPAAPTRRSPLPLLRTVVGQGPVQLAQYHYHTEWLATVDVSDPFHPRLGPPFEVASDGDLQYAGGIGVLGSSSVRLFDLSDPAQPVAKAWLTSPDQSANWHLLSRDLATVDSSSPGIGLWLYDLADLDHPQRRGHIAEPKTFGAGGGLLACGSQANVGLYDITDTANPVLRSSLLDPGVVACVAFWRGHLYTSTVRGGQKRLDTWDLTDPAAPLRVASTTLAGAANHLDLHGNRLYAQYEQGATIFDLTDPAAPNQLGAPLSFNTWFHGFAVNGNVTTMTTDLVTVRNDGLSPAAVPRPAAPVAVTLAPAWPNPCNPATSLSFTLDAERELALAVYDIRGRHVTDVAQGVFAAGAHEATWNGTDASGASVAAGVYLLRLHGAGVEAATTVTLIK